MVVATQQVGSGGQSYTFILPPGNYKLGDSCQSETASVSAGIGTKTNLVCPIP